jgi:hypothetical protein
MRLKCTEPPDLSLDVVAAQRIDKDTPYLHVEARAYHVCKCVDILLI